jgi:hypothetical protein
LTLDTLAEEQLLEKIFANIQFEDTLAEEQLLEKIFANIQFEKSQNVTDPRGKRQNSCYSNTSMD